MVIVLLLVPKKIVKYALIIQLSSAQQLNSTPCVCKHWPLGGEARWGRGCADKCATVLVSNELIGWGDNAKTGS